jgi:capsid assembly protease
MTTPRWDVLAIVPDIYQAWVKEAAGHHLSFIVDRRTGEQVVGISCSCPEHQAYGAAAAAAKLTPASRSVGDVAVVPIRGFISQKPSLFSMLFGGTSTEGLVSAVRTAVADPNVGSVILDVDSPGGEVSGVSEAANAIRSLRGQKPIIAVANPLMGSAAYHLASQADEIIASPSAIVGSIGAFAVHADMSEAIKADGIKLTPIVYGKNKLAAAPFLPLSEEGQASMQARVDYFGKTMVDDIAAGRGISAASVHARYGQGDVFTPPDAKARGLIDRIASIEVVASYLAKGRKLPPAIAAAAAEHDPVEISAWITSIPDLES